MSTNDASKFQRLLEAASALPDSERGRFLDRECRGDHSLRSQLESAIEAISGRPSFDAATADATPTSDVDPGATGTTSAALLRERPGTLIGPYKLLQLIGEGGFGSVFMAEQEKPVARKVALKIIKLGMDTRQVVARFEQERQALAMMDHPNIARVLDAGATEAGRPYFVMDLVKGEPISAYCDRNNLSIAARLELFGQVCSAVQHAHSKGIIHRDIKPSNILVSTADGKPMAKVIDFGIAKATASKLTERTLFTEHQQLIGTPEYMSPEQAEGSLDIDTRTDVYSLGVLLYQLLTGSTPFDGKSLRSAAYGEIQRIIREVEPPKPSTRLSEASETIVSVAAQRQTEPKRLGAVVRGELDWIVMKALEKDRARRYETANGLAQDVRRYLNGEAVLAAPASRAYRVRKFIRRNKAVVTTAALVTLALVAGAVVSTAGFVQASRQRDLAVAAEARARSESERAAAAETKAVDEARSATKIADFMASMLKGVGPSVALGRDTTLLKEILEKTEGRVGQELTAQPLVASRMLQIIAGVYNQLSVLDKAEANVRRGLEIAKNAPGDNRAEIARGTSNLGAILESSGKYDDAKAKYQDAYDLYTAAGVGNSEDAMSALMGVGGVLYRTGKLDDAEVFFRKAADGRRALAKGGDSESLASALDRMAVVLDRDDKPFEEAEKYAREALGMRRRLFGDFHPDVALSLSNLSSMLSGQKRFDEAIELGKQSIEQHKRIFGERHPRTAEAYKSQVTVLSRAGRAEESLAMLRLALEIELETLGAGHRTTLNTRFSLGSALDRAKDYAGAEEQYRAMLAWGRANYKPGDTRTAAVIMLVAGTVSHQGRHADAESLYREALEGFVANRPPGHASIAQARAALAQCLVELGRFGDAEPFLVAAEEQTREGSTPPKDKRAAADRLAEFYERWETTEPGKGYNARAAEWKKKSLAIAASEDVVSQTPAK